MYGKYWISKYKWGTLTHKFVSMPQILKTYKGVCSTSIYSMYFYKGIKLSSFFLCQILIGNSCLISVCAGFRNSRFFLCPCIQIYSEISGHEAVLTLPYYILVSAWTVLVSYTVFTHFINALVTSGRKQHWIPIAQRYHWW